MCLTHWDFYFNEHAFLCLEIALGSLSNVSGSFGWPCSHFNNLFCAFTCVIVTVGYFYHLICLEPKPIVCLLCWLLQEKLFSPRLASQFHRWIGILSWVNYPTKFSFLACKMELGIKASNCVVASVKWDYMYTALSIETQLQTRSFCY